MREKSGQFEGKIRLAHVLWSQHSVLPEVGQRPSADSGAEGPPALSRSRAAGRAPQRKLELCRLVTTLWGMQRSSDYCNLKGGESGDRGARRLVAGSGPGPAPTWNGARVPRHRGVGSPLPAASTLWEGASGRRRGASEGAPGRERGSPPNPWRVVSASNEFSVLKPSAALVGSRPSSL